MKIVGLDLSLTATGRASWNDGRLDWGVFKTPATLKDLLRLQWVRNEAWEYVQGSDLVVIEDFSLNSRGAFVAEAHGLGWMVRDWLQQGDFPYALVTPKGLKKFVAGQFPQSERSNKGVIMREVYRRWGLEINDDNAADATVLVQIGRCLAGILDPQAKYQVEVVDGLRNKSKAVLDVSERLRAQARKVVA